jgi:hypothetical protein
LRTATGHESEWKTNVEIKIGRREYVREETQLKMVNIRENMAKEGMTMEAGGDASRTRCKPMKGSSTASDGVFPLYPELFRYAKSQLANAAPDLEGRVGGHRVLRLLLIRGLVLPDVCQVCMDEVVLLGFSSR